MNKFAVFRDVRCRGIPCGCPKSGKLLSQLRRHRQQQVAGGTPQSLRDSQLLPCTPQSLRDSSPKTGEQSRYRRRRGGYKWKIKRGKLRVSECNANLLEISPIVEMTSSRYFAQRRGRPMCLPKQLKVALCSLPFSLLWPVNFFYPLTVICRNCLKIQ